MALSSLFCFAVRGCRGLLNPVFLDALRIDSPFPWRCFSSGEDADQFRALFQIYRVGDQQDVNSVHHSDGLPALLAVDVTILSRHTEWIVENQNGGLEADAVFLLVGPILAVVPGEVQGGVVMTYLYIQYISFMSERKGFVPAR